MDRRTHNAKKSKAAKDRENYETTTFSDMTSQNVFYTTESDELQRLYGYKKQHYTYDDDQFTTNDAYDRSKTCGNHDSEYRSDGLYSYDDYTTSAFSYEEKMRKPKEQSYPQSKSEEIYSKKMSPRRRSNSSPSREYGYFSQDEREHRKRLKLTRELEDEFYRDIQNDRKRRSHSPRRGYYYEGNSYEDFDSNETYTKYFEKTISREKRSHPHKHTNKKEIEDVNPKKNKKKSHSLRNGNDYQVFAYQEVDPLRIFKGEQNLNRGTLLGSEIEVHDYPVLAFKDPAAVDKGSDMVYLPVIVVDKKLGMSSDYHNVPTTPTQQGNYQIFTADLHDQRNIFHNSDQVSNQIPLASSNRELIVNKQTRRAPNVEGDPETTSGIRYAASFLGSIFGQPQFSPQSTREQLPDTKGPEEKKDSFIDTIKTNKNSLTYQNNIDVPSSNNIFQKHPFGYEPNNKRDQIRYTQIYDDYPVTKDYIKVNENTLEEQRESIIPKRSTVVNRVSMNPAHRDTLNERKNTQRNREASNMVSGKRSTVRKQVPEVRNNNNTGKAPSDVQRSLVMESKRGLMVTANDAQQNTELNTINVPASTRLSTVREGVPRDRSVRQTTEVATSREPPVDRRSGKVSMVLPSAASISQGPRAISKTSGGPQRISEANKQSMVQSPDPQRASERKIHSVTKSISPYNESVVEQGPPDSNRTSVIAQRASKAHKQSRTGPPSLARQQSKPTITGVAPFTDKSKTVSTESLKEFTKEVFPEIKNKSSAVLSGHPTTTKQSIIDMKATASMTTQKLVAGSKQSVVGEATQAKESRISFAPQTIEQEQHMKPSASGMIPTDAFESGKSKRSTLQEEKISSVVPKIISPDQKPKSETSLKGLASALVNLGRKSKSSLATTKPYIKVMPDSTTTRTSAGRAQEDNGSLFVRSIEPTSTLYKNEQQMEQSQSRRSRLGEDESKNKSKTKLPTVKEKTSKKEFFSKSRSKTNFQESESDMSPLSKKKSIWGILRRTKSKDSSTSLAYRDEQLQQEHVPMEGPHRDDKEPPNLQEKSCDCLAESVKHARTCAYFFLGTNLYQQVMNILTEF